MAHYRGRVIRYERTNSAEEANQLLSEARMRQVDEVKRTSGRSTEQILSTPTAESQDDPTELLSGLSSLKIEKEGIKEEKTLTDTIAIVTWNGGMLSINSKGLARKLHQLTSLAIEVKELAIVAVQELMQRAAAEALAERLCKATGSNGWVVLCPEHGIRKRGDLFNAIIYNSDRVQCLAFGGIDGDYFMRRPQFGLFRKVGDGDEVLGIINVHISYKAPTEELLRLPGVLASVQESLECHFSAGGHVKDLQLVILGDFNKESSAPEFLHLHNLRMVELVKPEVKQSEAGAAKGSLPSSPSVVASRKELPIADIPFLRDCTTSGREPKGLDNIWMSLELRRTAVIDANIYRTGGLLRGMMEPGYKAVARLRSQCSDHFPLVVKLGRLPPFKLSSIDLSKPAPPVHLTIALCTRHFRYCASLDRDAEKRECRPEASEQPLKNGLQR